MRWNSNNVRNSQSTAIVAGLLMTGLGITGLAISGAARAACTNVKLPFRPAAQPMQVRLAGSPCSPRGYAC